MSTQNRSDDQELVRKNLELIISSNNYQLAHEDRELLNSDEMRGVRMLLEINKPEKILEEQNILSTIIVFGGASLTDKSSIDHRLALAKNSLTKDPSSSNLQREVTRLKNLQSISHYYDSAREFAKIVSRQNQKEHCNSHVIVTGGGPGIMEAANRGAFDADCKSIGLNISLPNEQHPNSYITPGLCFKFNYFALRKFHFVMRSVAAVFFPGGFGTFDELFELLTLRQTGMKTQIPIILFGRNYWSKVINFQYLSDHGLISDDHMNLFQYADSASEAWDIIKQ
ncbi:LOG family protein [Prochlorococcus marinus]|uniref:Cytochrome D ubiquinol oxidase subunit II n=1 Tax=Prochlorococcus marinus XMU1408 TaxID=2213228 RepID=A0A318RHU9_PROMR|nr:LOG family protein [Prochlorococcus marinus]MBW3042087.1 cytochrome D ubiquinol oxidase subunit II [Prochlorococcus marinus str. XMU1408]PYE03203.1 cytochrome D ubiquinol oxidase subunit II [Prochlorococcus marinus XMU1408]